MLIRRTNLLAPVAAADDAWRHGADAVTLVGSAPAAERQRAILAAGRGGAEVFVEAAGDGDIESAVGAGLAGFVLRAESADEVKRIDALVTRLERERGLSAGKLSFIVRVETARAVWDIRSILTASPRISQAALVETSLAADLDITPDPEIDSFEYARGRLAVEATAAKVGAVGMAYPMSVLEPADAPEAEIQRMATKARNSGMKGVLCRHASWIAPVNAAFTPTPELVHYNRRVREAFAKGVAEGTAAVPLDGRMIDVPVDEWAIVVIATAEACAQRDAEKRAALEKSR
ncbi:MAG TPA: aldolase/citrate lyase family protein [Burkholderiales bacterium]|nr:aldolase/citrate lyase family protein [Burkholderiales bacterium]